MFSVGAMQVFFVCHCNVQCGHSMSDDGRGGHGGLWRGGNDQWPHCELGLICQRSV